MHAPDGFYSNSLSIVMGLTCTGVLVYSLKKIWKNIESKHVLLASAVGSFCFALQIANFEVSRGTSCHFMGGVFASIVLGPYLATIVMTLAHLIQVFLFQEGGIMALGPNLLTIVCISTFGGYYVYVLLKNMVIEPYGQYISAFLSAWLTLLVTSLTVCEMLSISGIDKFSVTLGPMVGPHVLVGIGEGILTVFFIAKINIIAPKLIDCLVNPKIPGCYQDLPKSVKKVAFTLLGLALVISIFISPFASRSAEGLRKFVLTGQASSEKIVISYRAPIPGYHLPGIKDHKVAHILGGTIGTIATFLFCLIFCSIIMERMSFSKPPWSEK